MNHSNYSMKKPFEQPLILIWGPGKSCEDNIGGKNLYEKRLDLKDAIEEYYKAQDKEVMVAFSEDDVLRKYTKELETFGDSDIGEPEKKHVEWSSIVICLDDPRIYLTLHSEIPGILLPYLLWKERPEYLRRVFILEPIAFLETLKEELASENGGSIAPTGSVALSSLRDALERLAESGELELIEPLPYTDDEFATCELRNILVKEVISVLDIEKEMNL